MFDFSREIILENDRVLLRPLQVDDAHNLTNTACEDEDLMTYSFNRIHTPELLTSYLEEFAKERSDGTRYPLIVFDKIAQEYAGVTTFLNISNVHQRIEIGSTWIGKKFQGTGLNQHCKFLLMRHVFEELRFERLEFKIDARNTRSRRAVEKIGGKLEGEMRSHSELPNGIRRNTVIYSMLLEEWPTLKATCFKELC